MRIGSDLPLVGSVAVLDLVVVVVGIRVLLVAATTQQLDVGYPRLFALLTFPLAVNTLSLAWSQDPGETLRASLSYAEGLLVYLFAVEQARGVAPGKVVTVMRRYVYLVLVPPLLMLARVPGFAPQLPGFSVTSTDFLGYYTRLSHPFIGRSNNLATVLAFFVVILLWWGITRSDRRTTAAGIVAAAAITMTLSRGVIISLALTLGLYLLVSGRRARLAGLRHAALIALVGLAATGVFFVAVPQASDHLASRLDPANISDRSELASTALDKVAARPLLGYGGSVTPDGDERLEDGVHNTYLQQVLSFGVVLGVSVSLSFAALCWFFLSRRSRGGAGRAVGFALLAQLLIFTNQSSFEGVVLRVLFYLSVGLGAGLLAAVESRTAGAAQPHAQVPAASAARTGGGT